MLVEKLKETNNTQLLQHDPLEFGGYLELSQLEVVTSLPILF